MKDHLGESRFQRLDRKNENCPSSEMIRHLRLIFIKWKYIFWPNKSSHYIMARGRAEENMVWFSKVKLAEVRLRKAGFTVIKSLN